jgi:Phage integrase, N-terminal SAM-like domain
MPDATRSQQPNLRDEVRKVLRFHHYSIHTERSYVDWIVRFVRFHGMQSREDLFPAEPKVEAFLTDRAVNGNVAPATQNQAMNALVFLYKRVLNHALRGSINAVRADKKINVPVVMTAKKSPPLFRSWTEPPKWSLSPSTGAGCASWKRSSSGSRTSTIR